MYVLCWQGTSRISISLESDIIGKAVDGIEKSALHVY